MNLPELSGGNNPARDPIAKINECMNEGVGPACPKSPKAKNFSPQDVEVVTDKDDSRCLHVTVHSPGRSSVAAASSSAPSSSSSTPSRFGGGAGVGGGGNQPFLSAIFTFDDHIRCMAAKQR